MSCFNLFTTYYAERRPERRAELEQCLAFNAGAFDQVFVWSERAAPPPNLRALPNLCFVEQRARPSYADLLEVMRAYRGNEKVNVLANCDIIIPRPALSSMAAALDYPIPAALCLARYEVEPDGNADLWDVDYSQDVWAFAGAPKPQIGGDYHFGVPGCDNRFAHELYQAGYAIQNPSRSIKTFHVHLSGRRTPTNSREYRVPPPYLFVKPTRLGESPQVSFRASPRVRV